ncbi:putative DsbA family dithiol-disulfide isomerase [Streptomyces sp. Amel2xB2]|uniref:DsbA family oxidoreductase n=1 Tax=Streptomyces sp. Amel2xB2 TaxID=1305829 RepID=UPI000DB967C6|nr:DsbA family protein [Streptomyces sp. Amel2xB2]RAJ58348.1 putative DsbA family dithiol-disulfide isomerase [Streptomyces sp. Amel2xB2]
MTGDAAPTAVRAGRSGEAGQAVRVTEFTDPACPWAWGSEPALRLLRHTLGRRAAWRRVFGILFEEDDDPPPDPDAETRWYEGFVTEVAGHTGAPFALPLRRVTRTSWPASQAARAAEVQGPDVAERVLRRLREAMFVLGAPVDEPDGVREVVRGVPGLDVDALLTEAAAPRTRASVERDWSETRQPPREVLELDAPGPHSGKAKLHNDRYRYALPTVLFEGAGGRVCVPGWRSFEEYLDAARTAAAAPLPGPSTAGADEALGRWRSLTLPEFTALTGRAEPPAGAVRVETAGGPLWLHPDEARVHPVTALSA